MSEVLRMVATDRLYGPEEAQRDLERLGGKGETLAVRRIAAYIRELEKAEEALAEIAQAVNRDDVPSGDLLQTVHEIADRVLGGEKKEGE